MNQIDVSHTIISKSDQLNATDLPPGDSILKIVNVKVAADKDQPVQILIEGYEGRPYKPCLSMRRVLIAAWGQYAETWIGQSIAVYCENSVLWAGKEVGGIRITSLTGIDKEVRVPITINRYERGIYLVQPLIISEPVLEPVIDWSVTASQFILDINACTSISEMEQVKIELGKVWKSIPADLAANITAAAETRKRDLTA
jgi:hypothetical protein